jgi:hypothetical protein
MQANPPAIPFTAKTKRNKVKVGEGEESADQRVFNVPLDATSKDKNKETYKHYMACFEEGTPEDWCSLRTEAHDLFLAMGIDKDPDKQHNVWRSLLKGQAKDRFTALYNATRVDNDAKTDASTKLSAEQVLRVVLNGVAKHVFTNWQHAIRNQKQYMQHALSMGSMEPGIFCERLQKMNRYLTYFPTKRPLVAPSMFAEDELLNIVGLALPVEWSITMLTTNQGIETFDKMENAVIYFKQLYQADQLRKQLGVVTKDSTSNNNNNNNNNKKRKSEQKSTDNNNKKRLSCLPSAPIVEKWEHTNRRTVVLTQATSLTQLVRTRTKRKV